MTVEDQDSDIDEPNPYREVASTLPKPLHRPTGVTVTGVLCCVGGIVGILMGISMIFQSVIGPRVSNAMVQPGPMQRAQVEMNEAMLAVTLKYQVANVALSLTSFVIGCCLLAGGIGVLRGKKWGQSILLRTLVALMVFECFRLIPYAMMQSEMLPIMETYMQRLSTPPPGGGGGAPPAFLGKFVKVMMIVGFAAWILWAIIKLTLCAMGHRYLRKPHVVRFFEVESSPPPATP